MQHGARRGEQTANHDRVGSSESCGGGDLGSQLESSEIKTSEEL